jgi:hypothetical protein
MEFNVSGLLDQYHCCCAVHFDIHSMEHLLNAFLWFWQFKLGRIRI